MVNKELVKRRLLKLSEYVLLLKRLREYPKDAVISDPFVYGNIERYLQLAIQTVIDISNHILAERRIHGVNEYREALERLGKEEIIPPELSYRIAAMVGLRNILVHEYLDVDRQKLYDILHKNLDDFKEFATHVTKLL